MQKTEAKTPDFDAIGLPADKSAFIHLCWLLHNQCNHRCSYCSEINWGGSFRDLDLNQAKNFVEKAIQHFHDRRLMVSFTGGEPTLWPEFGVFVDWLKAKNAVIAMTTNGTRHRSFFQEHAKSFSWISFSYHPEFTRADRFLENVIEVSRHCPVSIRIMFPPTEIEFDKSKDFLNLVKKYEAEGKFPNFVRCETVPVATGFGTEFTAPAIYSTEQEQLMQSSTFFINGDKIPAVDEAPINDLRAFELAAPLSGKSFDAHDLISSGKANFENWLCDIGLEQLFIDHRGQVVRAGCRVGGLVGWLKQGFFDFPTGPVLCPKTYCHCITDVLTSKRSPAWQEKQSQESVGAFEKFWFFFVKARFRFLNWMTQTQLKIETETESGEDSNLGFSRPVFFILRFGFKIARFLVFNVLYNGGIRIFWSRPIRKPYYFIRFQYRKRILGKMGG